MTTEEKKVYMLEAPKSMTRFLVRDERYPVGLPAWIRVALEKVACY